jgi:hypothetical protein
MAYTNVCPRGHDKTVVGVASNRQCRACRRAQQTTSTYQARRRERQRTELFHEYRSKRSWKDSLSRFGRRLVDAMVLLDPRLRDLIR